MNKPTLFEGGKVTTRYFGGYEAVKIAQVHDTYLVVSRFGGQVTAILPKDRIAKTFGTAGNETFCSDSERGLHPEVAKMARKFNDQH